MQAESSIHYANQIDDQLFDRHKVYIRPPSNLIAIEKLVTLSIIQNAFSVTLVKTSICIFILRLIHGAQTRIRSVVYVNLIILISMFIVCIVVLCMQCIPLAKVWNPDIHGKCVSYELVKGVVKAFSGRFLCCAPWQCDTRKDSSFYSGRRCYGLAYGGHPHLYHQEIADER